MDEKDDDGCEAGGGDFIVPVPMTVDGRQVAIRHREDHTTEVGTLGRLEDGKPIPEEARMVELSEDGRLRLGQSVAEMKKGPAKVASPSYRSGWDRIFGTKATVGQA